ncbi:MAG: arylsulfatase [Actinobacteria bacterium]|nr:MAG: arylsulfatase [Actinomycetota bacterium]
MDARDFGGVIGRHWWDSVPWWPEPPRPPDGAPNIVFVVLDDTGFAQLGCFGSDIETPTLDRLANGGLRFTNFHTTALCSPTRSCVLTGRNHHSCGMGRIADLPAGFPGYDARIPRTIAFLPQMLAPYGYASYAVGKWHLTPEDECNLAATRARWPLSRGFDRFYGFFGGETHQFAPALVHDSHFIDAPATYDDGYHLTADLVDHAITMLRDLRAVDADRPFFLYFATGACHSPHHSPVEWRDRYRGRFDGGWDAWRDATLARQLSTGVLPPGTELSPRPDWVPAWDSLSADEQRVYARYMEAFAAYLSHTDHELDRLFAAVAELGELDDTVVMVLSDNGASSEGGPGGSLNDARIWNAAATTLEEALARIDEIGGPYCHNNYPWGWTVAGNTPFRRWKREVHEGGVCDPLVVHWPSGIHAVGETRRQFTHAIDLVPTVLEIAGIEAPAIVDGFAQRPIEGTSFAYAFEDAGVPERHTTQYFEMFGCRGLYQNGWKAVTYHQIQDAARTFDDDYWELYHVDLDPSECHDLAAAEGARLRAMIDQWWIEAAKHQVLPLDNRPMSSFVLERPHAFASRDRYVYYPDTGLVPEIGAVNVRNRTHVITAEVVVPPDGADGVLLSHGSALGGWTFFVLDGCLHYAHNFGARTIERVDSHEPVPPGAHRLSFRFDKTGEHQGRGSLLIDDRVVGENEITRFTPMRFSLTGGGLKCGESDNLPVVRDYEAPFRFTGELHRVVVDVEGPEYRNPFAEAQHAVQTQ